MKVKISIPGLPDGTPVGVTNLNAEFLNNKEVDVSDEAISDYEVRSGRKFGDLLKSKKFKGSSTPKASTTDAGKDKV